MRWMLYVLTIWTSIACMGPDQETLVDELRVMAIQAEPAEIQLRDFGTNDSDENNTPVINVAIADPLDTGYMLAIWPCTNIGDGCEERKLFEENPNDWIKIVEGHERLITVPVVNNPLWALY